MISKSKLDHSFPMVQFEISGYTTSYKFDILLYIRVDRPSKTLHVFELPIEGLFVQLNLYRRKALLRYIYNPHKKYISNFLQEFWKTLDVFSLKYSNILIIGNFREPMEPMQGTHLLQIYFLLTKPHRFCNTCLVETGLSDFHKMTLYLMENYQNVHQNLSPEGTSKVFLINSFDRKFYLNVTMTIISMVKIVANLHIPYKRKDTYFSNLKKHAINHKISAWASFKKQKESIAVNLL